MVFYLASDWLLPHNTRIFQKEFWCSWLLDLHSNKILPFTQEKVKKSLFLMYFNAENNYYKWQPSFTFVPWYDGRRFGTLDESYNVVHIYHNYKDFNSFSVLSPENEISDIFISFYFTEVFPNKKKLGILIDNVNIYRQSILTKFEFFSCWKDQTVINQ